MSDLSHDSPGVQGLAQLGRNAIERVSELERERDETIRKLSDPVAVHVAMLRGEIAVPPLAELLHVYGATFSNLDAANIELAKERETIRQLRAHLGNLLAVIHCDGGHYQNAHGTIKAVDDAIRIVAERNAQLDEYKRARPTQKDESDV